MNLFQKVPLAVAVTALLALPAFAQLGTVTVTGVTGETGSVIVMRGPDTFSLKDGDTLQDGDVVMARAGGTVTVNNGLLCSRDLGSLQSITISENLCDQLIASVDSSGVISGAEGVGGGGIGAAAPIIGGAAILGGAAAAAGGGGGDDAPTSR